MSATVLPSTDDSSRKNRLKQYLLDRVKDGEAYLKSKFTVDDAGLSPGKIGALMAELRDSAMGLPIEKWSHTSVITWRVRTA